MTKFTAGDLELGEYGDSWELRKKHKYAVDETMVIHSGLKDLEYIVGRALELEREEQKDGD